MERSALLSAALLTAAAFSSACNDLGSCDDDALGRTTVANAAGELMFTGQAVINTACLPCHSSKVSGAGRKGAPAGLNFDLLPIMDATSTVTSNGALVGLDLTSSDALKAELAGLRARQRKVYDERELIWEQVEKGLMPPGKNSTFKNLSTLFKSVFGADMKCARGESLKDLDTSREEFRNWLACDTPIIEATSSQLPYKAAADTVADKAAGAGYYSVQGVSVGYQYPSCSGGGGGGDGGIGGGIGFDEIYNTVFAKSANQCLICHSGAGAMGSFDIGTIDTAYTTLLGASGAGGSTTCAATPVYVKKNDPENSYLLNMVVPAKMRCTANVMPLGMPMGLPAADVALITRWIMAGAPRTAAAATATGGSDAGVDAAR